MTVWLLFDFGGVISYNPTAADWTVMAGALGTTPAQLRPEYWSLRHDYDLGVSSDEQFWSAVAARLGVSTPLDYAALVDADVAAWARPREDLLALAGSLAKRHRLAVLSNMGTTHSRALGQLPQLEPFSRRFFSAELGLAKPEPEIFEYVLRELGVEPAEAVFIDDHEVNIDAARALGIDAILFTDTAALVDDLARRGVS